MKKITILKIGGKVIDNPSELDEVLRSFSKIKGTKILVHGGGCKASNLAKQLGINIEMINGRRITSKSTLDIVTMVYAGLINKHIISKLQYLKTNALGLSGADLNVITSSKREVKEHDFGFVGDIQAVNTKTINRLLKSHFVPAFCAITHNKKGQLLNTNADSIASALAISMTPFYKVKLIYHFDKKGVLKDPENDDSVLKKIRYNTYSKLKEQGTIRDGMIPKIDNAFHALHNKVRNVIICGTNSKGTKICL